MTPLDAARSYIRRGWAPVPIPHGKKGPTLREWQKLRIGAEDAWRYFNGQAQNVGVILGEASNHLADADLDCAEAVKLAPFYLPPTEALFGRAGKPRSHWLYQAAVKKPLELMDPEDGEMLAELRTNGGQTVFPGSTHPSGETIEWVENGDPSEVDPGRLITAVKQLAGACILLRHNPQKGRHCYLRAVSGWLLRNGWKPEAVKSFLLPVARLHLKDRADQADEEIRRLVEPTGDHDKLPGFPKLVEHIGEKRARKLAEWLGVGSDHAKPNGWPDLDRSIVSPQRIPAPPLPLQVFGPFWSDWLAAAAEGKGAPVDYVAMPLLSVAGGLLANVRRGSPWASWVEPPVVWVSNVGNPSSGKSPAADAVIGALRAVEAELDSDFDDRRRSHTVAAELAKAKRDAWEKEVVLAVKKNMAPPEPPREMDAPEPPTRRRLFSSDPTIEKLGRLVAAHPRGFLLVRDELAGWLGGLDKYGGTGTDRAFYLEGYGGRPYVIDRVKDGDAVRVPFLSVGILGGIQPDRLATLLFNGDDDGMSARFIYAWPEPMKPRRPRRAADEEAGKRALAWLAALPQDEHEGRPVPRVVPFEPAAADAIQAWREQVAGMEADAAGLFLSWLGKLPGMAVRLATLFEYLWWAGTRGLCDDEPKTIGARAATAALAFLEGYVVPMARRAFGDAAAPQAERDAAALARWLLALPELPTSVNARALRRKPAISGCRDPERYDRAMNELVEAGWVRPAPSRAGETGGRRGKDFDVNPALAGARS